MFAVTVTARARNVDAEVLEVLQPQEVKQEGGGDGYGGKAGGRGGCGKPT